MLRNAEHSGGEKRDATLMSAVQIGKALEGSRRAISPYLLVLDDGLAKHEVPCSCVLL
jgi:hypothetical protein